MDESNDTLSELQAFKRRQTSLREKMQRRKKEREDLLTGGVVCGQTQQSTSNLIQSTTDLLTNEKSVIERTQLEQIERKLLNFLCDRSLKFPIDSNVLCSFVQKNFLQINDQMCDQLVDQLLQKFLLQDLIVVTEGLQTSDIKNYSITSIDLLKLINFSQEMDGMANTSDNKTSEANSLKRTNYITEEKETKVAKIDDKSDDLLESLLSLPTIREKQSKQMGEEILALLSKPTAKERSLVEQFRSVGGAQVQEFCQHGTKEECIKANNTEIACTRLHFKKIIQNHTDESLGDCSFLNTCFHMDSCKYVHYLVDYSTLKPKNCESIERVEQTSQLTNITNIETRFNRILFPAQWIRCDLRYFDMSILGKFSVVMADPPWDIHMELPYGTMSDDEMRNLDIPLLQDEGIIFLWVTGRAMELGRECLSLWGYERCDEIIWVKTNQLQRIIRTGRTGHWINHGKEHCLVGIKGNPPEINRGLDCDVIVAEVRATSHKPDEIYGIIERLAPGTRKIELFGRQHNTQPNWVTLGNQLDGVRLIEPQLVKAYKHKYPEEAEQLLSETQELKKHSNI